MFQSQLSLNIYQEHQWIIVFIFTFRNDELRWSSFAASSKSSLVIMNDTSHYQVIILD